MRLEDLFEVRNGVVSTGLSVFSKPIPGTVLYLRPASTQQRTIAGWVSRNQVGAKNIYPEETLFVSTNGEGSHSYSYVSRVEFACNSDVSVLLPKREMSLNEKIFYARCITMNRYKFSYGRKPKGERLKKIELPSKFPSHLAGISIDSISHLDAPALKMRTPKLIVNTWAPFELQNLFEIRKGQRLTKADMLPGKTPYVGASDSNNGITAYIGQAPIHDGGTISVSYNGSVAEAFYQSKPFWATDDVNVLYPKGFALTPAIALFVCTVIRLEKYRFNYGRKWHLDRMRESVIKLPVEPTGKPDWNYLEHYIKTLPYSSQIDVTK